MKIIKTILYYLSTKKCKAKDCKHRIEKQYRWCSFECAIYDGAYSVTKGWLI